jgi:hypothetical protein
MATQHTSDQGVMHSATCLSIMCREERTRETSRWVRREGQGGGRSEVLDWEEGRGGGLTGGGESGLAKARDETWPEDCRAMRGGGAGKGTAKEVAEEALLSRVPAFAGGRRGESSAGPFVPTAPPKMDPSPSCDASAASFLPSSPSNSGCSVFRAPPAAFPAFVFLPARPFATQDMNIPFPTPLSLARSVLSWWISIRAASSSRE